MNNTINGMNRETWLKALYLRLDQDGTSPQQKKLLNSLIEAMGQGSNINIQWICN